MNSITKRHTIFILLALLIVLAIALIIAWWPSDRLLAMQASPAANLTLTTGVEYDRDFFDGDDSPGFHVSTRGSIRYVPAENHTQDELHNEIIATLEAIESWQPADFMSWSPNQTHGFI